MAIKIRILAATTPIMRGAVEDDSFCVLAGDGDGKGSGDGEGEGEGEGDGAGPQLPGILWIHMCVCLSVHVEVRKLQPHGT